MLVRVAIEYCSSCGFQAKAIEAKKALLEAFGRGNVDVMMAAGRPSSFEIEIDDEMVYSGLEKGVPSAAEIVELVQPFIQESGAGASAAVAPAPAPEAKAEVAIEMTSPTGAEAPPKIIVTEGTLADMPKQSFRPLYLRGPLFWFPYIVNKNAARSTALVTVVACIAATVFLDKWSGRLLTAALFADFLLRFVLGPSLSFGGAIASAVSHFFPIAVTSGPPKQFAQFVGMMMSGAATLTLYLETDDDDDDTNEIIARIILAVLAFFAFLEGALDFCAGCWMYKMAFRFGLVKGDPSRDCDTIGEEVNYGLNYARQRVTTGVERPLVVKLPEMKLPLKYKAKSPDMKKEDFSFIRHMHVTYFGMPMALTAFAGALRIASDSGIAGVTENTWEAALYVAEIVLGIFTVLYVIKAVKHPRKVVKEFDCPMRINSFAAWSLSFIILAFVEVDENSDDGPEVLFWIGAPFQMVLTGIIVARWITRVHPRMALQPHCMIAPVGNVVAGFVMPQVNSRYAEAAYLWYSVGVIMWLVLFPMTLQVLVNARFTPHPLRSGIAIYLAAPAAITYGNRILTGELGSPYGHTNLILLYFTFFSFWAFFVIPGIRGWLNRSQWDMSTWAYGFPLCALSFVASDYVNSQPTQSGWPEFIAVAALAIACFATLLLSVHTISGIIRRAGIFVPNAELAPMSFVQLTHFAFRNSLSKLQTLSKRIPSGGTAAATEFATAFYEYAATYFAHAEIEDNVLFPAIEALFPGTTAVADADHHRDEADMAVMLALCKTLAPDVPLPVGSPAVDAPRDGASPEAVDSLLDTMAANHNAHFDLEERHLMPVGMKNFSALQARRLARAAWLRVTPAQWRVYLPFVVNNMDVPKRRTMFLSSLAMAVPDQLQLIGRMLYEKTTGIMWNRCAADVPDMIPGGLEGHAHLY